MSSLGTVQKALIESKKAEARKKRDARLKALADSKAANRTNRNNNNLHSRHLMNTGEVVDYTGPSGSVDDGFMDENGNTESNDSGRKPSGGDGQVNTVVNADTNTDTRSRKRGWDDALDGLMDDADFWDLATMNETDAEREKEKAKRLKEQQDSYNASVNGLRSNSNSINNDNEKKGANAKPPKSRIDTNAGFLMPSEQESAETDAKLEPKRRKERNAPEQYDDVRKICKDCGKGFYTSYLEKNFGIIVCDQCKRIDKTKEDIYGLVTKTTAKKEYLLTDGDLENRDYSLRFVTMANPGGSHFAPMKLYSRLQVEEISFKRFGGEVGLDLEIEKRQEAKIIGQKQKYQKKVQDLKRTTLAKVHTVERHVHEWGPPTHDAKTDMSEKKCKGCGVAVQFCSM